MLCQSEVAKHHLEVSIQANCTKAPAAIRVDLAAVFVFLELSRSKWLVTSISPGGGEKMSRRVVAGGDIPGLLGHFADLQRKAKAQTGQGFPIISIQEAGLDGFWIHRILEREEIESYIIDPASIATSRRRRRAKTDRIDGEALVRALLAQRRDARRTGLVAQQALHPFLHEPLLPAPHAGLGRVRLAHDLAGADSALKSTISARHACF